MSITDTIDNYNDQGLDETFEPDTDTNPGPSGLWKPAQDTSRIRQIPTDALGFQTYALDDYIVNNLTVQPTQILNKRPEGIAAKVRIALVPVTGGTGRVYLIRSASELGNILIDKGGSPYISNGYFLGAAAGVSQPPVELYTSEGLFAVCLNTVGGVGGMITVASEIYYAE